MRQWKRKLSNFFIFAPSYQHVLMELQDEPLKPRQGLHLVIPAEAGIHLFKSFRIPACAGMTINNGLYRVGCDASHQLGFNALRRSAGHLTAQHEWIWCLYQKSDKTKAGKMYRTPLILPVLYSAINPVYPVILSINKRTKGAPLYLEQHAWIERNSTYL